MLQKLLAVIFLTVLISCNEKKIDTKVEGEKLMELSRYWSRLASTDSIDKVLSFWADDATILSPGQGPITGKQAIRNMLEETGKIPGFRISWEPLSVSVSKSGDMAYMIEQNQITMNDSTGKPVTEYNKALTIWRKEADGTWKNVVDTWNADPTKRE